MNKTGIIHVAGSKAMSMYDLAKLSNPNIQPMTLDDYYGPSLTVNMTLRSERIRSFGLGMGTSACSGVG